MSCSMRLYYNSQEQASEVGRWCWVCLPLPRKEKGPGLISFEGLGEKPQDAALSLRKVGTRHCGSRRSIHIPVYLKTPERPLCLAVAPGCRSARVRSQYHGCGSETG